MSNAAQRKQLNSQLPPSNGTLTVQEWLNRVPPSIAELRDDSGDRVLDGIWCGTEGTYRTFVPELRAAFVVQWCYGKVDTAYIT